MLNLVHLIEVRDLMLEEFDADQRGNALYRSPWMRNDRWLLYPDLMREALRLHNEDWLAAQINTKGLLKREYEKRKPKGGSTVAAVPWTAAQTLAEGEFNRYYIRATCRVAINRSEEHVEVYRAKQVSNPRRESELLIGTLVNTRALLDDLRRSPFVETVLGIPAGANSGISVKWTAK